MRHVRFSLPLAALALLALLAAPFAAADSKERIDAGTVEALKRLEQHAPGIKRLMRKAKGVAVFPDIVKMGFAVGGQYGEGELLVKGKPVAYYATAGASFGLQLGVEYKSEVLLFMTDEALLGFRGQQGWQVGVDASVTLPGLDNSGKLDTSDLEGDVIGFIFSNDGLMTSLSFEGTKITRIAR